MDSNHKINFVKSINPGVELFFDMRKSVVLCQLAWAVQAYSGWYVWQTHEAPFPSMVQILLINLCTFFNFDFFLDLKLKQQPSICQCLGWFC